MRTLMTLTMLGLLLGAGLSAYAADPATTKPVQVETGSSPISSAEKISSETEIELARRAALNTDLESSFDRERAEVAELVRQLEVTPSFDQRQEIQREISAIKSNANLERMQIQLGHAQQNGHLEKASILEGEIERFIQRRDHPAVPNRTAESRARRGQGGQVR